MSNNRIKIPYDGNHSYILADAEEVRKALAEHDKAEAEKEKLYDGLTKEQWKRVIDGGYYCRFSNNGEHWSLPKKMARIINGGYPLEAVGEAGYTSTHKHCRPIQEYGHITPHFGGPKPEWVDDNALIVWAANKHGCNFYGNTIRAAAGVSWKHITEFIAIKP